MRLHVVQTADSGDLGARRDVAPAAANGRGAPSSAQGAPEGTTVVTDRVAPAQLGRALSMQRRRQLSQGKQALDGGSDRMAAARGAGAPGFIVLRGGGR